MTSPQIALTAEEAAEVRAILHRILPSDVRVFVFGSRAGGRVKPWSDLDLAFIGQTTLSLAQLGALADAFDNSSLPWKVDLVDLSSVSESFARIIDSTKVPFA